MAFSIAKECRHFFYVALAKKMWLLFTELLQQTLVKLA
jgi:hypothetical protein